MFTSRIRRIGLPLTLALGLATLAPTASAQKYSSRSSKGGGVSVQFGTHGVSLGARYGRRSKNSSFDIAVGYGAPRHYGRKYGHYSPKAPKVTCCSYVPGQHKTVKDKVWVAGRSRRVWIAPEFHVWTDECGDLQRRRIAGGFWQTVQDAGYWKTGFKQVWVPGHSQCSAGYHH
jgi:hypothetical protein